MIANEVDTVRRKMTRLELFFPNPVPPKKNSKQIFTNRSTGKPFITASKRYKEWESTELQNLEKHNLQIISPCRMTLTFFPPNRRAYDMGNKRESIQDLLVKAGILEEDNFKILQQSTDSVKPVNKDKPGVHVLLETLNSEEAIDFS